MKIFKILMTAFSLLIKINMHGQSMEFFEVKFKEMHTAPVNKTTNHPSGEYFITSDASGKILMWSSHTYNIIKTIRGSGTNTVVRDIGFINNSDLLFISYDNDSISTIPLVFVETNEPRILNGQIFYNQHDNSILVQSLVADDYILHELDDNIDSQSKFEYLSNFKISFAKYNESLGLLAFYRSTFSNKAIFNIYDFNSEELVYNETHDAKIIDFYFDKQRHTLIFIKYSYIQRNIIVEELDLLNFISKEIATFDIELSNDYLQPEFFSTLKYDHILDIYRIIILPQYSKPLMLEINDDIVIEISLNIHFTDITSCAFGTSNNHLLYFRQMNGLNQAKFNVYDISKKSDLDWYSLGPLPISSKNYFLSDNSIFVIGEDNYFNNLHESFEPMSYIKYYRRGTLSNRFARLNFHDYMKFYHNLEPHKFLNYALDKNSDKLVFRALIMSNESNVDRTMDQFVIYDILNDKVDLSFNKNSKYPFPIAYRDNKKRILASGFFNYGDNSNTFAVIDPMNIFEYPGKYILAELSFNGNHLLLLDVNKEIQIYNLDENTLIYKKLIEGYNFHAGPGGENGFWLTYFNQDTDSGQLYNNTIILDLFQNEVKENVIEKIRFTQITIRNDKVAISLNDRIIALDTNKFVVFSDSEHPIETSFNNDASLLSVSLSNGYTKIYDTENLAIRGTIFHPDSRSHVIIDSSGNFNSNTEKSMHLSVTKNFDILDIDYIDNTNNNSFEVLNVFGQPDSMFQNLLYKCTNIRNRRIIVNNKSISDANLKPKILSIMLDGQPHLHYTTKNEIQIALKVLDSNHKITDIIITINGVKVINRKLQIFVPINQLETIIEKLPLVVGVNLIRFYIMNENGTISEMKERKLFMEGDSKLGNLHLLTIGVSEYKSNEYNLTFADKDAVDLAMLYGDSLILDMTQYKDRYFGKRYYVYNSTNKTKSNELRQFSEEWNFYSNDDLFQIDYDGNLFLQCINGSEYYLWNFRNSQITKISLPVECLTLKWHSLFDKKILHDPDNNYFYFKNKENQWYCYSLNDKNFEIFNMPFRDNFFALSNNRFATIEFKRDSIIGFNDSLLVNIKLATPNGNKWKYTNYQCEFDTGKNIGAQLLAVSSDGSHFLISIYDKLWVIYIDNKNIIKLKVNNLESEYGLQFFFTKDNNLISSLKQSYTDDRIVYKHYLSNYHENLIDSQIIEIDQHDKIGLNNIGGELKWITFNVPIAVRPTGDRNYYEKRTKANPVSFDKVYVHTLINEHACFQDILDRMKAIGNNVGLNDQIIFYFAGHGVLDDSLNYFFAPHNMDFSDPALRGISYLNIVSILENSRAIRKLLIMDTCHSGDVYTDSEKYTNKRDIKIDNIRGSILAVSESEKSEKISDIIDLLFDKISSSSGITVLSACSGLDVSIESRDISNGAFTSSFIEELDNSFIRKGWGYYDASSVSNGILDDAFLYKLQRSTYFKTKGRQVLNIREVNKLSKIILW